MNRSIKVITGFAAGALAGAIAGILLTPKTGPQNRRKLTKESERLKDSLGQAIQEMMGSAKGRYNSMVNDYTSKRSAQKVRKAAKVS